MVFLLFIYSLVSISVAGQYTPQYLISTGGFVPLVGFFCVRQYEFPNIWKFLKYLIRRPYIADQQGREF